MRSTSTLRRLGGGLLCRVVGHRRVRVRWRLPHEMGGIFEHFIVRGYGTMKACLRCGKVWDHEGRRIY